MTRAPILLAAGLAVAVGACAHLGALAQVQAPRFEMADGRQAELRLLPPSAQHPMGGAAVRIWARVENPNPISLTLSALAGDLYLENTRAAVVDFPLGMPLVAGQDTVIPIDIGIGFGDMPGLGDIATRALTRGQVGYRLDGTVEVDAGVLGRPTFGPRTWLDGALNVFR
jgi:hypothetical protein